MLRFMQKTKGSGSDISRAEYITIFAHKRLSQAFGLVEFGVPIYSKLVLSFYLLAQPLPPWVHFMVGQAVLAGIGSNQF